MGEKEKKKLNTGSDLGNEISIAGDEKKSDTQINYESLRETLDKPLKEHPDLFGSSKGKDIVVLLGLTGSGKSTLINFLNEKKLKPNDYGEIVLEDPKDPSAMTIGVGDKSETRLPQFATINDLLFYDFPGLNDTEGAPYDVLNALFIKHVIEQARTTRVVIVAGLDEITTSRGRTFKNLINRIEDLLPSNVDIGECSSCVITKSSLRKDKFTDFLKLKIGASNGPILDRWIKSSRISQMSKPNDEIDVNERNLILGTILEAKSISISEINGKALFSDEVSITLQQVFQMEIGVCLNTVVTRVHKKLSEAQDAQSLEEIRNNFKLQEKLDEEIKSSKLITLLEPLLKRSCTEMQRKFEESVRFIELDIDHRIQEQQFQYLKDEARSYRNTALVCAMPLFTIPVALPLALYFETIRRNFKEKGKATKQNRNQRTLSFQRKPSTPVCTGFSAFGDYIDFPRSSSY